MLAGGDGDGQKARAQWVGPFDSPRAIGEGRLQGLRGRPRLWIPACAKTRERRPHGAPLSLLVRFQSRLVLFRLLAVFLFAVFILAVELLFVQLLVDDVLVLRLLFVEALVFEGHA